MLKKAELLVTQLAHQGSVGEVGESTGVLGGCFSGISETGRDLTAPLLTDLCTGLTFEQQKELLMLQNQSGLNLEKLRQDAHLCEAKLAQVQAREQLELERYKRRKTLHRATRHKA